jgi:hypothetical protein
MSDLQSKVFFFVNANKCKKKRRFFNQTYNNYN